MSLRPGTFRTDRRRAVARVPDRPFGPGVIGRRLVTVVHMDIVGYTRLLAADDVGTLERMRQLRVEIVEPELLQRGGRLVQSAGDALLLTFNSILGAVEFAIETQRRMNAAQLTGPSGAPMNVRIGIDISDTIADQKDLHGDGINIAARLQTECPPGGVCISRTVHEHVEGRVGPRFHALGYLTLKNVSRPIEAFYLRPDDLAQEQHETELDIADAARAASVIASAPFKLDAASPPRNSIAVLPFVNFGKPDTEDYFANGVVDDIITALTHFRNLFVIARDSSFSFGTSNVDVADVARDLGVDYIVEGSIRRANNRVRISARLVFAKTRKQLWGEKFDAELVDIFVLQDTISQRIATAVEPQILAVESNRAWRKPTHSLDAYDYYLRAQPYCEGFSPPALTKALQLLSASMELDPAFGPALASAAACHLGRHDQGWSTSAVDDKKAGLRLARAALRTGADDAMVLCRAGHAIAGLGADYAGGAELLDQAVELNPNYAQAWMRSSIVRVYLDDPETAIRHADKALSLSPRDSRLFVPLCAKGYAFLLLGDYEAAAQVARRALASATKPEMAHRILITALWHLRRTEEMSAAAQALMEQIPSFRVSKWRARVQFTQAKRFDMMEHALRYANVPE